MRALRVGVITLGMIVVLGGVAAQARSYTLDAGVKGQASMPSGTRLLIDMPITRPSSPKPGIAEFLSDKKCLPEERCVLSFPHLRVGIPSFGAFKRVSAGRVSDSLEFYIGRAEVIWNPILRIRDIWVTGEVRGRSTVKGCPRASAFELHAALPRRAMEVYCTPPGRAAKKLLWSRWQFSLRLSGSALSSHWTLKGQWSISGGKVLTRAGSLDYSGMTWDLHQDLTTLTGTGRLAPNSDPNLSGRVDLADGSVVGRRLSVELIFYWSSGGVAGAVRWIGNIFKASKPGQAEMAGTAYESSTSNGTFTGGHGPGSCFGPCPRTPSP